MKKMLFIFLMFSFLCLGCSTPEVRIDPTITDYRLQSTSIIGMKDMTVISRIVKLKKVMEGKEQTQVPEFVKEFSKLSVDSDTIAIYVMIRVTNPNKIPYKLIELYDIKRESLEYPFIMSHKIYDGSLSNNELQVYIPFSRDVEKVKMHLELKDANDQVRNVFANLEVTRGDGERGGARLDKWGSDPRDK